MIRVPSDAKVVVPRAVLTVCTEFFRKKGRTGCEGTGLLIGRESNGVAVVERAFFPEQECVKTRLGVSVRLTPAGHLSVPGALAPGERYFARIHSHPGRAFHSEMDDDNGVITHEGALSLVVPNFAREAIEPSRCAVFRHAIGKGWQELAAAEIARRFEVVG